jgi:hypothetical protein
MDENHVSRRSLQYFLEGGVVLRPSTWFVITTPAGF